MAALTKSQVRAISWGATYLWDIRFPDAPAPFNQWFPATDVEENLATLNTKPLELFISTYEIPLSTTLFDLKITFTDDVKHTIEGWISSWINTDILNDGSGITPLADCCKLVQLTKTNFQKEILKSASYWVFPKGALYFHGTSDASAVSNMVEFVIAGTASNDTAA